MLWISFSRSAKRSRYLTSAMLPQRTPAATSDLDGLYAFHDAMDGNDNIFPWFVLCSGLLCYLCLSCHSICRCTR